MVTDSTFHISINCQTCLHSTWEQRMQSQSPPIIPNTCHCLSFWLEPAYVGVKCNLTAVLICNSLMTKNVENVFMSVLAVCTSPLERCLCKSTTIFHLFVFLLLSYKSFLHMWLWVTYQAYDLQYFSYSVGCLCTFLASFAAGKFLILMQFILSVSFSCHLCFWHFI